MSKEHTHTIPKTSRTKAQLQQELALAHQRIAELESYLLPQAHSQHQLAQEALRVSEEKFRSIFEAEPECVKILDAQGHLIEMNQAGLAIIEADTFEQVKGCDITRLVMPAYRPQVQHMLHQVFQGNPQQLSFEIKGLKGGHKWLESHSVPLFDPDKKVIGLLGITRDITARHQAEMAMLQTNELNRRIIESLPCAFVHVSRDGAILTANSEAAHILGLSYDVLAQRYVTDFETVTLWEDGSPCSAEEYPVTQAILTGQAQPPAVIGVKRPDGSISWSVFTAVPVFDSANEIGGAVVSFLDITKLKAAEAIQLKSESKFQNLVAVSPVPYAINDSNGNITYLNPAFIRTFGYTPEDIPTLAAWWPKAYPDPEYRQWVAAAWQASKEKALSEGGSFEAVEVKICCKDGSIKSALVGAVALGEAFEGNHLVVLYDISELRAAEEDKQKLQNRLIQAQKMETVGRLAGGVAHDFNNMLTVILGNAEMALMETSPKQKLYKRLEEIYHAAGRSSDMTKQLLAFARKQPVTPKIIDLNEIIKGTMALLKRLMHEQVQLVWQPGPGLWLVRIDPTQVHQILVNLCVNARDAIAAQGTIAVNTQNITLTPFDCQNHDLLMPGEYVMLSVSDTGCGIEPSIRPSIFEPFFTTKPLGEGSGLGLSIVYGIVSQNNGFIDVHSTLGQGSVFKLYLPRYVDKPHLATVPFPSDQLDGGKETVLLVDDEPAVLRLTTNMLEVMGYQVLPAHTPSAALQLAQSHPQTIHLLLSDVIMPEMNGPALAHHLLIKYPQMKVLFMSGYTTDSIYQQDLDNQLFIQKPCSMTQLATRLRAILDET